MNVDWSVAAAVAGALVLVGGALVGVTKWARPRWRDMVASVRKAFDSINGRDAQYDSITGEETVPALPGIGVRMNDVEKRARTSAAELAVLVKQTKNLTETVQQLAEMHLAQNALTDRVDDHEKRIVKLENSQVERIVARAESAAAFHAMEAAIKADPNEVDLPDDDVIDVEPDDA